MIDQKTDVNRFFSITPSILSLVTRIDTFKNQWRFFTTTLSADRLAFLKKRATIEAIGASTRLSSSPLTDHDVHSLVENLSHHFFISHHEQNIAGYFLAYEKIITGYHTLPITAQTVQSLHESLLRYSHKDQCHRGHYKNTSLLDTVNHICAWYMSIRTTHKTHLLLAIAVATILLHAATPFHDGNGRIHRLLINFFLLEAGYPFIMYCSLDTFFEQEKDAYHTILSQMAHELDKESPDITSWITFFLHALMFQIEKIENIIAREKTIAQPPAPHTLSILALLESYGKLSIAQLTKLSTINRNTLKKYLRTMTSRSLIVQHGTGRATWYTRW